MNSFYKKYYNNVYSQNGEDGIIEELLKRLNITCGWVCEFGAWDGMLLSNTFNLVKNYNFNAVYIEGDTSKFLDLINTSNIYNNIIPINEYVHYEHNSINSLDNILKKTNIPADFDILSIDIDSFDYQVWDSLEYYKPKIVIIEINSSISPDIENHIHTPGVYDGTSFLPTLRLGIQKGYKFVLHTGNMIFVRNDFYNKLDLLDEHPFNNFVSDWLQSKEYNYNINI